MAKYSVNNYSVDNILSWIDQGEIAIPEMQRPFVWESSKVRDLIDSLYKGYPVGYIIIWKNPDIKLKLLICKRVIKNCDCSKMFIESGGIIYTCL